MFSGKSYEQYLTWQDEMRHSTLRRITILCKLEDYSHLSMIPYCRGLLEKELVEWHKWYLPQKSIEGKTVLDAGAGCGETAFFYLNHGAKHVICVEPPGEALQMLKKNFGSDSRVTIVESSVDLIKSDIEGAELDAVFEVHFPVKFKKIAGGSDPHASIYTIKKKGASLSWLKVKIGPPIRNVRGKLRQNNSS